MNADEPIEVAFGNDAVVRLEQLQNADEPIDYIVPPTSFTVVSFENAYLEEPQKAYDPIEVASFLISTCVT